MSEVLVALAPETGVSAAEFVAGWNTEGSGVMGRASAHPAQPGPVRVEIVDWVVIPMAVNLASSALYDGIKRVVARLRNKAADAQTTAGAGEYDVVSVVTAQCDSVVVVRPVRQQGK